MTRKPVLPVVDVDQTFPLMTADSAIRSHSSSASAGNQTPAVEAAIRDVLGWRPRAQDAKAFSAALDASFTRSIVEDHVHVQYVQRGYAIQADLGGVTGGQASLYTRAQAGSMQITRILDALTPLRTDSDPQDCEAYRILVRDSVRQLVAELGTPGGPRIELVDSAFGTLTGYQAGGTTGHSQVFDPGRETPRAAADGGTTPGFFEAELAAPGATADDVPGQLGALRDRFGLIDDNVNTVEEEQIRTSFVTLVDFVLDLQRSWDRQRDSFGSDVGRGFLGTELVVLNRLLAAAAEQVDEVESVLDSALVSGAERQTIVLNARTRLTLDGLLGWLRVFLTEDGPRIARDTGRDGLTTSFTPTVLALVQALRQNLVNRIVPCGSPTCAGSAECRCGRRGAISYLPLGCGAPLPPGLFAARTRVAISTLCGMLERLETGASRIGRFSGVVLVDVTISPISDVKSDAGTITLDETTNFLRVEVRGLHLRPTYVPAFVVPGTSGRRLDDLVLPVQGSASARDDTISAIFSFPGLSDAFAQLDLPAVVAAADLPIALVDGESGRVVTAPAVVTWPTLQPANDFAFDGGPTSWGTLSSNQRWVPQSPGGEPFREPDVEDDDEDEPDSLAARCSVEELQDMEAEHARNLERVKKALAQKQRANPPATRKRTPRKSTARRRG